MNNKYINIVITADNLYTKIIGIAMFSILKNLSSQFTARFFIFSYNFRQKDFIELNKIKKQFNCEIEYIKMEEYINRFNFINVNDFRNKWISIACYFRLLIFDILPNYIEQCYYVDGDIIVDCDLSEIRLPIGKLFSACPEAQAMQHRNYFLQHCNELPEFEKFQNNPIENPYFNAGFFIVDLKKSRELKIYEQIIDLLKKYPKLPFCDQDLLNIIFGQKYRDLINYLEPEYNVFSIINYELDYNDTPFNQIKLKNAFYNPKIIHYAGAQKPWNCFNEINHEQVWWNYYKKSIWGKDYYYKKFLVWLNSKNGGRKALKTFFSIFNEDRHKVIQILGIKIKFKRKNYNAKS